jgi:hypothetical protein
MSDVELTEYERDIERLGDEILVEEWFDLAPVYKALCERCDFIPLCRKHPEFGEN